VRHVPFIYSDPDIIPIAECPVDVASRLFTLLGHYSNMSKAGLGIKVDDLPEAYRHRDTVLRWEEQFWREPLEGNCFNARVDTTFALYRPGAWPVIDGVRSSYPYLGRHMPWYEDSTNPSEESRYYAKHAVQHLTSWSGEKIWSVYRQEHR
jgi:hypothetical protein